MDHFLQGMPIHLHCEYCDLYPPFKSFYRKLYHQSIRENSENATNKLKINISRKLRKYRERISNDFSQGSSQENLFDKSEDIHASSNSEQKQLLSLKPLLKASSQKEIVETLKFDSLDIPDIERTNRAVQGPEEAKPIHCLATNGINIDTTSMFQSKRRYNDNKAVEAPPQLIYCNPNPELLVKKWKRIQRTLDCQEIQLEATNQIEIEQNVHKSRENAMIRSGIEAQVSNVSSAYHIFSDEGIISAQKDMATATPNFPASEVPFLYSRKAVKPKAYHFSEHIKYVDQRALPTGQHANKLKTVEVIQNFTKRNPVKTLQINENPEIVIKNLKNEIDTFVKSEINRSYTIDKHPRRYQLEEQPVAAPHKKNNSNCIRDIDERKRTFKIDGSLQKSVLKQRSALAVKNGCRKNLKHRLKDNKTAKNNIRRLNKDLSMLDNNPYKSIQPKGMSMNNSFYVNYKTFENQSRIPVFTNIKKEKKEYRKVQNIEITPDDAEYARNDISNNCIRERESSSPSIQNSTHPKLSQSGSNFTNTKLTQRSRLAKRKSKAFSRRPSSGTHNLYQISQKKRILSNNNSDFCEDGHFPSFLTSGTKIQRRKLNSSSRPRQKIKIIRNQSADKSDDERLDKEFHKAMEQFETSCIKNQSKDEHIQKVSCGFEIKIPSTPQVDIAQSAVGQIEDIDNTKIQDISLDEQERSSKGLRNTSSQNRIEVLRKSPFPSQNFFCAPKSSMDHPQNNLEMPVYRNSRDMRNFQIPNVVDLNQISFDSQMSYYSNKSSLAKGLGKVNEPLNRENPNSKQKRLSDWTFLENKHEETKPWNLLTNQTAESK